MISVENTRIQLIALDAPLLRLYLRADGSLEQYLGAPPLSRPIPERLARFIEEKALPLFAHPVEDPLFSTVWIAFDKESCTLVAEICLKGTPNAEGEVEIGYGTYEEQRNKGYMTDVVYLLTQWALKQEGVKAVTALTDPANVSSQRVLIKNDYLLVKQTENNLYWRKELP